MVPDTSDLTLDIIGLLDLAWDEILTHRVSLGLEDLMVLRLSSAFIFRLCDLQSLKRARRQAEAADRSGVKGLQRNKKKKEELRLGDITSGEEINNSDGQTNSEDSRDEFEGFQVVHLTKPLS